MKRTFFAGSIAVVMAAHVPLEAQTPPVSPALSQPAIQSAGDAAFGKGPVRVQTLAEVEQEIAKLGVAGAWQMSKKWEIIINSLASAEVPVLLDAVEKLSSESVRQVLRTAFFSRWGEMDPAAAMDRANRIAIPAARDEARQAVVRGWAYTNPKEVVAWLQLIPEGAWKKQVAQIAAGHVIVSASSSFVGIVAAPPGDNGRSAAEANRLSAIGAKDIPAAIAEAAKHATVAERVHAYSVVGLTWVQRAPAEAAAWAIALPEGAERDQVADNVLSAWARKEQAEANGFIARLPKSAWRTRVLASAFSRWGERDIDAAVTWARTLPDPETRAALLNTVLEPWFNRAPDTVVEHVLSLSPGQALNIVAGKIVARWAEADPKKAGDFFRRLNAEQRTAVNMAGVLASFSQAAPDEGFRLWMESAPTMTRYHEAGRALANLAKRDAALALRRVDEIPEGTEKHQILRSAIEAGGHENAETALAFAAKLPSAGLAPDAAMSVVNVLGRSDISRAVTWAKSLPAGQSRNTALQAAVNRLAEAAPERAVAEAIAFPPGASRTELINQTLMRLAMVDSRRAVQLLESIDDPALLHQATRSVASIIVRTDPIAAVRLATLLPAGESRTSLVGELLQNWAQNDPIAVAGWGDAQPDAQLRAAALTSATGVLASHSVTEAAKLLLKIPAGERFDRAASQLAEAWSRFDPAAGARWAATLPSGYGRMVSLQRLVPGWARADRAAASAWLGTLPEGAERDAMIGAFLSAAAVDQPAELTSWIPKIADQAKRHFAIETIARHWLRLAPDAANRWLAETDLPEERRKRLRPFDPFDR